MKILFDNGTPKPISRSLPGHEVTFARQIGWHELENGELIQKAEQAGYEVLVSTDKKYSVSAESFSSNDSPSDSLQLPMARCPAASG
jgi:hypothetical protein